MSKRLSIAQVDEMKQMVIKNVAPEDIAKHFNIAISSVHNYKARFKAQGVKFESQRGKRPKGTIPTVTASEPKVTREKSNQITGVFDTNTKDAFKFIINGVSVQISADAKSVNIIDKNTVDIKF